MDYPYKSVEELGLICRGTEVIGRAFGVCLVDDEHKDRCWALISYEMESGDVFLAILPAFEEDDDDLPC